MIVEKEIKDKLVIKKPLEKTDFSLLVDTLKKSQNIKKLHLENMTLDDKNAAILADALLENQSIKDLELFRFNITQKGAKSLVEMLKKRKEKFELLLLCQIEIGAYDYTKEFFVALKEHHPRAIDILKRHYEEFIFTSSDAFDLLKFRSLGKKLFGRELTQLIAKNPTFFLSPVHPNPLDVAVFMLGPYQNLYECHCIRILSRTAPIDCRKMAEDKLVTLFESLDLGIDKVFRYASLASSEFLPDVINIAKLSCSSRPRKEIAVDLIDAFRYSDHRLILRDACIIPALFQFLALLHRMDIQVKLGENASPQPLLLVKQSFELFNNMFSEKITEPVATVTLRFYDSFGAYTAELETSKAKPHVVLDVDSDIPASNIEDVKKKLKEGTYFLSVAKRNIVAKAKELKETLRHEEKQDKETNTLEKKHDKETSILDTMKPDYEIRVNFEQKQKKEWVSLDKPQSYSVYMPLEEELRKIRYDALNGLFKREDPFSIDSISETSSFARKKALEAAISHAIYDDSTPGETDSMLGETGKVLLLSGASKQGTGAIQVEGAKKEISVDAPDAPESPISSRAMVTKKFS